MDARHFGLLLLAAGCGGGNSTGTSNQTPDPPAGNPATAATIEVRNDVYVPSTVLMAVGGTVTWEWIGTGHSVTSTGVPAFSPTAPISNPPKSLVVTFANAGSYAFYCTAHGVAGVYGSGQMTGVVFVR